MLSIPKIIHINKIGQKFCELQIEEEFKWISVKLSK